MSRGSRVVLLAAVAFIGLVGGGGCGTSSSPPMSASAAHALANQVADLHGAVSSGDLATAENTLRSLQSTVIGLERKGQLSASRAVAILAAVADVQSQLALMPTTTTTTTTAVPAPSPPGPKHGKGDQGPGSACAAGGPTTADAHGAAPCLPG